jgi:hypothetical protein
LTVSEPVAAIFKLAQTSPAAVAVIAMPAGITTLSVANGATPVDQLAPFSHVPDEIAVFARTIPATKRIQIKNRPFLKAGPVFFNMLVSFQV